MPDMVHSSVGDLVIVIHSARPPGDKEWTETVATQAKRDPLKLRTLVFTDGGAPNSRQRNEVTRALGGKPSRAAIVSPSTLVRSVVTALGWFNPMIRAFAPTEVNDALQYLSVPQDERQAVWDEVLRLRDELGDANLKSVPNELN